MRGFIRLTSYFGEENKVYIKADSITGLTEKTNEYEGNKYTSITFGYHSISVKETVEHIFELMYGEDE